MERPVTYARARLWTGISGVGTAVVAASWLLIDQAPSRWLAGRGGDLFSDAAAIATTLGVAALAALPFDVAGGLVLPRRFGRPAPSGFAFALRWLRGVGTLMAVTTTCAVAMLAAGRTGGVGLALAAFVGLALALASIQAPLARLVGGLRRRSRDLLVGTGFDRENVVVLEGDDPGFSGGFSGFGTMVVPAGWTRALEPSALSLLLERRKRILSSGSWIRALALAIVWNAAGFGLATRLPGAGVTTPAELVTTALGFTLWTFVGLLVLPTPSRAATRAADSLMSGKFARERLVEAFRRLDRLGDDEPARSAELESVFHPIPSVENRARALETAEERPPFAWHLARTALFLSHAGLSFLPRAVHCNAGRPELWVYLPADG